MALGVRGTRKSLEENFPRHGQSHIDPQAVASVT